jgi:hypothetical protein
MSIEVKVLASELDEKVKELHQVLGTFMAEFSGVETLHLSSILNVLCGDTLVVDYLEELMDFSDRLKLMLKVTESRYPEFAAEAKKINSLGKKLSEERNRIAHGAAMVFSASVRPDQKFEAGIRRKKSERKVPPAFVPAQPGEQAIEKVVRDWYITADDVRAHTEKIVELRAKMIALQLWLHHRRHGHDGGTGTPK